MSDIGTAEELIDLLASDNYYVKRGDAEAALEAYTKKAVLEALKRVDHKQDGQYDLVYWVGDEEDEKQVDLDVYIRQLEQQLTNTEEKK